MSGHTHTSKRILYWQYKWAERVLSVSYKYRWHNRRFLPSQASSSSSWSWRKKSAAPCVYCPICCWWAPPSTEPYQQQQHLQMTLIISVTFAKYKMKILFFLLYRCRLFNIFHGIPSSAHLPIHCQRNQAQIDESGKKENRNYDEKKKYSTE